MATWQEKLVTYKTDQGAAIEEVLRAKQVYGEKQAAGDTAGMQAAERWANQVRAAAGLDDSLYGAGVTYDQALANYNASTKPDPAKTPETTQTQNTGTATTGQLTPEQIAAQAYTAQLAQMQAQQQALAQAQRQSRIAALQKAKESALSGLEAERATIDPYYYERRKEGKLCLM